LQLVFGVTGSIDGYRGGGQSYREIVRDAVPGFAFPQDESAPEWQRFYDLVYAGLRQAIQNDPGRVRPLPGAVELVEALSRDPELVVGLMTGNPGEITRMKLRAGGFDPDLFVVTAFGNEANSRVELLELAWRRAGELNGQVFRGPQTVIIGDTLHDVRCARARDARCILVQTGDGKPEELEESQPDYLFEDLSDTQRILAAIRAN
jgi:phosphoglycolate phosphatase-like HAD superfamily hydrolase